MIGQGNVQSVSQGLPFSVDADVVSEEVGYLNGSKVTVGVFDPKAIVGIQVSEKRYEGVPKNARFVKITFKDFRKWLKNCYPVKALEHLLMGQGKRKLLKQNWIPITQDVADEALRRTVKSEDKKTLSDKIKQFNTTLSSLAQKKRDHAKLKLENNEFEVRYKTILAMVDGKITSRELRKNLVVALPPSTEGDSPQYILLASGSHWVRKAAAKELAAIFCQSSAYRQFLQSKSRVYEIQAERKGLKKSLGLQANDIKKLHGGLIQQQVDDEMLIYSEEIKQKEKECVEEINDFKKKHINDVDNKIGVNAEEIRSYAAEVDRLKIEIKESKGSLVENKQKLNDYKKELAAVDRIGSKLQPDSLSALLNMEGIAQAQSAQDELKVKVAGIQEKLVLLNGQLKSAQHDLDAAVRKSRELKIERERIIDVTAKDMKEKKQKLEDSLAEKKKGLAKNVKNDVELVKAMVSGSPKKKKRKVIKSSSPIEPGTEG